MTTEQKAVNGVGWEVQLLTPEGWKTHTKFPTRDKAEGNLGELQEILANHITTREYRVYESLEC
jgi:hypothetical protein